MDALDAAGLERVVLLYLTSSDAREPRRVCAAAQRRQAATIMQVCRRWRDLLAPLSRSWRARARPPRPRKPYAAAVTESQKRSLAELPLTERFSRYEACGLEDRSAYFDVSCCPITKKAEDDMELLSDLSTWGERFLDHWAPGACFRRADLPMAGRGYSVETSRGAAAGATWIFRGDETPRVRRGHSAETGRGAAAVTT